jgi:hypothetical protein
MLERPNSRKYAKDIFGNKFDSSPNKDSESVLVLGAQEGLFEES